MPKLNPDTLKKFNPADFTDEQWEHALYLLVGEVMYAVQAPVVPAVAALRRLADDAEAVKRLKDKYSNGVNVDTNNTDNTSTDVPFLAPEPKLAA